MTRKLFYEDPMLQTFTARVTGCEPREGGYAVVLDATAFYPEGGGQAADTGSLSGVAVLDTREVGEQIVHLCREPLAVGTAVEGIIDFEARFDRMQQHTGEHILSGLIHAAFGYHNVGFHMGNGIMEVDFDGPITPEQMAGLEAKANAIVWENRPVRCYVPAEEALAAIAYRSKRALPWPVRIVEIPGADICACCGTHAPFTGMGGLVKVLSVTKFHQGVRLEMACGRRALQYLAEVCEQNRQVSQLCSAKPLETAQAVQKLTDALAAQKLRANTQQTRIMEQVAAGCEKSPLILHFEPELDGNQLRFLAERLMEKCDLAAVFTGREQGFGYCLASKQTDLRPLGKQMHAALGGRGGGKPGFQQGTVAASRPEVEAWFGTNVGLG